MRQARVGEGGDDDHDLHGEQDAAGDLEHRPRRAGHRSQAAALPRDDQYAEGAERPVADHGHEDRRIMVAEMLRDRVLEREDRSGGEGEEIAVGFGLHPRLLAAKPELDHIRDRATAMSKWRSAAFRRPSRRWPT